MTAETWEEAVARFIRDMYESRRIVQAVRGEWRFHPQTYPATIDAPMLRALADELDRRNKP